ncbi:hypothetical protein [Mesorhizobium sp. LjNodule214]|uniref:hypothetical protein n=1 Tax=Mesorhizobium sp. LjNodule214 TaxID=3342252 RepID=UPI003ECCD0BE
MFDAMTPKALARTIFVQRTPSTEIAMPQKTLADTLAARKTVYVNCGHPMCGKSTKLDIAALIDRLGPDHGSMHADLVRLFGCSKCKAAGRDRRPVFFTYIPDYEGQQRELETDFREA